MHTYLFIFFSFFFSTYILNGSDKVKEETWTTINTNREEEKEQNDNKILEISFEDNILFENKKNNQNSENLFNENKNIFTIETEKSNEDSLKILATLIDIKNRKEQLDELIKVTPDLSRFSKMCFWIHRKILKARCIVSGKLLDSCLLNIKKEQHRRSTSGTLFDIKKTLIANAI